MKSICSNGLVMAAALLLCLLPMPYGYYVIVRFLAMMFFACLAFTAYNEKRTKLAVVAGGTALLFQPFCKVALGREAWNVVDVVAALALVALWYKNKKTS